VLKQLCSFANTPIRHTRRHDAPVGSVCGLTCVTYGWNVSHVVASVEALARFQGTTALCGVHLLYSLGHPFQGTDSCQPSITSTNWVSSSHLYCKSVHLMAFHMLQKANWLLVLFALSFWCISANASITKNRHRHPIAEAVAHIHRRRANATSFIAVRGVGGFGSDVQIYPRLEIRELEQRPDEFNIFLLGLQRWMEVSQDHRESYFQIAGRQTPSIAHQRNSV
jgi:hypothetical protein